MPFKPDVLVFSPPHKKEQRPQPSESLFLKAFTKCPSLNIVVAEPGRNNTVLLSVQNIENVSTKVFFQIPKDKPLQIRPETCVMQPQSVEIFEITAIEAKESFRCTLKVTAPDLKGYRGGQVSVSVEVKQPPKQEKRNRPKAKTEFATPVSKPKAVTVPIEFRFQPSREARKAQKETPVHTGEQKIPEISENEPNLLNPIDKTFNLEELRRQTYLIKHQMDHNQTYLIPAPKVEMEVKDPVSYMNSLRQQDPSLDVRSLAMRYLDFARRTKQILPTASERERKALNSAVRTLKPVALDGNVNYVLQQLTSLKNSFQNHDGDNEPQENRASALPSQIMLLQMEEKPRRSSNLVTSSPKREALESISTPERLSGMSQRTLTEIVNNYLPETTIMGTPGLEALSMESPDVSAIYPLDH